MCGRCVCVCVCVGGGGGEVRACVWGGQVCVFVSVCQVHTVHVCVHACASNGVDHFFVVENIKFRHSCFNCSLSFFSSRCINSVFLRAFWLLPGHKG